MRREDDQRSDPSVILGCPSVPRRVVHVTSRYPPVLGGLEQVAQALARQQQQLGMDVQVLTSDQGSRRGSDGRERLPVTRLRSIEIAHTVIIPGLLPALARFSSDTLFHLHVSSAYVPEMVWLTERLTRVPYIAHVHLDVLPSGWAGAFLEPYKRLILRRVLRNASTVLVPTHDYVSLITAKYGIPSDSIRVIPNGTDHRLSERPRSGASFAARPHQLLFVGRLTAQKNIPLMLEAIAAYVQRYGRDLRLSIVGDGEAKDDIREQVSRLKLSDIVTLHGSAFGGQLESMYRKSDLLLLTSINESFGLVLIEAMTKGLPIVSVDIPGVRNVVTNGINGILSQRAPEAIADAVRKLLTNQSLYAVVSANNLSKARQFSWESIAREISKVYGSV